MTLGRLNELDASERARIDAVCNFINDKIARLRRQTTQIVVVVCVAAALWWITARPDPRFPLFTAFVISGFAIQRARSELARSYKTIVIRRVVNALGQGLTYSHESTLTEQQFVEMDLFNSDVNVWKSEDQITAQRNEVSYALHDVYAARKEQRGKRTVTVTVFRGTIAVLEFNKHFRGHTIVVADKEGQRLGGLLGETEMRRGKQIVRMADADFESRYTVYTSDDQQAHYVLTPRMMQLILQARGRLGADLRLAFYDNSLVVAIPSDNDRFEVGLNSRVTPYSVIAELLEVVALAERLIETLDLETRVWSRT